MNALTNLLRVFAAGVWTAIVGTPLVITIYLRYWYGLVRAKLGRRDLLDRALELNAHLAGWVAQRLWASVLLAIAGVKLRVREIVPVDWNAPHVLCANHASLFDILALIRVVPPPFRFVAKRELVAWPIVGWALRPAGQIVIDRADHSGALRNIAEAAVRKIRGQVIFFVEGTRSRSGQLMPFKKGAFHFAIDRQLPVLPAAIRGSYAVLAKLPWWRMRPGREIDILFCRPIDPPPIPAEEQKSVAVHVLLRNTRERMSTALGSGSNGDGLGYAGESARVNG